MIETETTPQPEQRDLVQALIDSVPDIIFCKDLKGVYIRCNRAFEALVGTGSESILGRTDPDLFPQELADFFRDNDRRMLAAGEAVRNEEWVEFPGGRKILLETLKTPYYSPHGELLGLVGISRDITESHASHDRLANSLSMQQATLESTADGILVVDKSGSWQSYNQKFLQMWRIPRSISDSGDDQGAIAHVLEQLRYPDAFVQKVMELYAAPDVSSFDELLFNDGRVFERFSIPQVMNGKTVGRVWSFRDVTARKQAESSLKRHAEILEMIATGQSAASIYDAIALMYEALHPGMRCSMLELKGTKLMHGGAPSLPAEYCEAVNGLEIGPGVGSCGTSTYTGKRVLVENIETDPKWDGIRQAALPHGMRCCWSEPIKNSKGEVLGAFGMYYDHPALPNEGELADLESAARLAGIVMERDQREEALRKSENKYRTLVENLPQRFFLKDRNSAFVSCSNNLAEDLGTTPEQIVGKTAEDYFPNELAQRLQQDDQRILHSGVSEELEETIIIDGVERTIHMVKAPAVDEHGDIDGVLGIFWDVTEQKLLEEKYLQAQKMESVGTLVGGVAHEFNNTLAGITGRLFLAQTEAKGNPKVLRHLETISKLSFRAAEMIQQLLAFSRKSPVKIKQFDLLGFIRETFKLHKFSIPENIRLETHFCHRALAINGDESQVQQILVNLLNNARDAVGDTDRPRIDLYLDLFEADQAFVYSHPDSVGRKYAHLTVADNGCGISEKERSKIFDPFFTTKEVGKGTGLGLAMVYGAVRMHEGIVEVDSEPGRGTRMHVYLPVVSDTIQNDSLHASSLVHGKGESILFVDDESELRELGREVLESLGYSVLEASNGAEAIETYIANQEVISLVVMDVVMPETGGLEAALAIKGMNKDAKVIFCTGYDGRDVLDASVLRWAEVISKPYRIDEFSHTIKRVMLS